MRMLRWMNGNALKDRLENENIQVKLEVGPIEIK